jgi:hypothetical protein
MKMEWQAPEVTNLVGPTIIDVIMQDILSATVAASDPSPLRTKKKWR